MQRSLGSPCLRARAAAAATSVAEGALRDADPAPAEVLALPAPPLLLLLLLLLPLWLMHIEPESPEAMASLQPGRLEGCGRAVQRTALDRSPAARPMSGACASWPPPASWRRHELCRRRGELPPCSHASARTDCAA